MQFAAARHDKAIRRAAFLHAQRDIVQKLPVQTVADVAAGDELPLAAGERRVVHLEGHAHGRLVDVQRRQGLGGVRRTERGRDLETIDAGDADDVAGLTLRHFLFLQAEMAQHRQDARVALGAVGIDDSDLHARANGAAGDAAHADHAHVVGVVERADLHLERAVRISWRRRHTIDDQLQQRRHVFRHLVGLGTGDAVQRRGVHHGEVELGLGGTETVEEIENLIDDPVGPGTRPVDLVHHHDGVQAGLEGLACHEARLGHRAVHRVDQQQHTVDHREDALHLAAEVGVAGSIDDVDAVAVPVDRGVLREDGDAALTLLIVGVHDALLARVSAGESSALLEEPVDQRGLAVVDVGDNGDVAQTFPHRNLEGRDGGEGPAKRGRAFYVHNPPDRPCR